MVEGGDVCVRDGVLSYEILRIGSMREGSKNLLPR
jgi:hypothetical protein